MSAAWILLFVLLSAAPIAKLGDVQILEIAQALCLTAALPAFMLRGLRVRASGLWRDLGGRYLLLLACSGALAIVSLRLTFFSPPDISLLKRPLWISLSRIFELFLVVYYMLATAETLRRRSMLFRLALDVYIWAGTLSACISIAAWSLMRFADVEMFAVYGFDQRARGFFNEGGPFGVFVVSVAAVVLLRTHFFRPVYPALRWAILGVLAVALALSQSKAGLLVALGLCGIAILCSGRRFQKVALVTVCVLVLSISLNYFGGKVFGYFYAYLNLEEMIADRPGDPSLIMGRVAASVIVPRMIAAHPVLGIGVGNYSLMRNDPAYLENLPPVDEWDLAGMGLIGSAAELGVPLTLFLLALLLRPVFLSRKAKQPVVIAVAATFQPLAFLLGANLNFFYPWLVAAFALAAGAAISERNASA